MNGVVGSKGQKVRGFLRGAALIGASSLALGAQAMAQTVDGVEVRGAREGTGIGRLPNAIEETPQAVHVIDEEELQQQGVISLDQAVRNIPGLTANTGEGGGATAGDQFRIRGVDAQNDLSTDGLRDFGAYTRDAFAIESVQVYLGPSGQTFGRGSFGGAINSVSRIAKLEDSAGITVSAGSADLARVTADANRELGEHSAFRVGLMMHQGGLADIDGIESNRWGFAGSFGLGLGTDTSFTLHYLHQTDDRIPYYGVPVATPQGQIGRPLPVERSTWYGTEHDRDNSNADVITARLSHQATPWLELHNDTRYGRFDREFMTVAPGCSNTTSTASPPIQFQGYATTCTGMFFDGNPGTIPIVSRGAPNGPYYLDQWGIQNVTTAIGERELFGGRNQFIAGIDVSYESADRLNTSAYNAGTFPRPNPTAIDPSPLFGNPVFIATNERGTTLSDVGAFLSNQYWFNEDFSILAGVRFDRYEVESTLVTFGAVNATTGVFTPTTPNTSVTDRLTDSLFSPRVSLIWEPGDRQFYYVSYARSAQPPTGTSAGNVGTPVTANLRGLDPTTSETYELGGRIELIENRLNLQASLFRTERDNALEIDGATGAVLASGDQQRAQGLELQLDGAITDRWTLQASYTFLDTETLFATAACGTAVGVALSCPMGVLSNTTIANPQAIGREIPFAARNSATLWTSYTPVPALTLGFGVRFMDEIWLNNTNTAIAPYCFSIDAAVQYRFNETVMLQVNATNLADREENYDQLVGGRAAHSPGRAFVATLSANF